MSKFYNLDMSKVNKKCLRRYTKRQFKTIRYSKYDLTYKNVHCSAVKWKYKTNNIYIFTYYGKTYKYKPISRISTIADTDNIRIAITLFLDEIIKQCYKCFHCGCGECPHCKY